VGEKKNYKYIILYYTKLYILKIFDQLVWWQSPPLHGSVLFKYVKTLQVKGQKLKLRLWYSTLILYTPILLTANTIYEGYFKNYWQPFLSPVYILFCYNFLKKVFIFFRIRYSYAEMTCRQCVICRSLVQNIQYVFYWVFAVKTIVFAKY